MSLSHRKFHWIVGMDINTNINHYYMLSLRYQKTKTKTQTTHISAHSYCI